MAESELTEQNLPETFKEIWKLYDILEKTEEPTGSDKVQGYVYHACELCKKAISMVNKLHLFSENEDIEEVSTIEVRYMLLPALMGYFLMKNTVRDRLRVVQESKDLFTDYMRMCRSYNVTKYEVAEPAESTDNAAEGKEVAIKQRAPQMPSASDVRSMAGVRANKVQRFKEQKELEKKLTELRDQVEKDHVDDDVRRDYYLTLLKRWVNISIEEVDSIQGEIQILEMMARRKADGSNNEQPRRSQEEHKSQPLRPFIITKDAIQKQIYGLGYPSLPTLTIEEFFDQKVEEGTLSVNSHSMQDWARDPDQDKVDQETEQAEKEARQDKDDPVELAKVREWDEYKDDHRRGWGNRKNRH